MSTSSPAKAPSALRVNLALIAVQIAFGTLPVTGKLAMTAVGPFALSLVRMVGAAVVLGAMALRRGGEAPIPRLDVLKIAGCGLLGVAGNQVLFLVGLERTSAANAAVLITTVPVFTFAAATLLGRERFDRRGGLGLALALGGVLAVVPLEQARVSATSLIGDALIVVNALCYALFMVLVRPLVGRHGSRRVIAIAFGASVIAVAPFGAPELHPSIAALDPSSGLALLYVVLVPTILTYLLNTWALGHARASTVAIFIYLQPLVGLVLAAVVLGEPLGARMLGGAAAIVAGVAVVAGRRTAR
ncbi:MAG: DMT family transporter [Sandaracinaceae bacterium]|nr:DMT family transporter [Sandaracinaceae bacterium]